MRVRWLIVLSALLVVVTGCASFSPRTLEEVPFRRRVQTQSAGAVSVSAVVPTLAEAKAIYGVDLSSRGMQPVWLEVENGEDAPFWFLSSGMDPHYFSPTEAAYAFHRDRSGQAAEMDSHFEALAFENPIMPGETVSGFVLVNLDEGYKAVDVDLVSRSDQRSFTFIFVDPDFNAEPPTSRGTTRGIRSTWCWWVSVGRSSRR
jgi:hypothetical protein